MKISHSDFARQGQVHPSVSDMNRTWNRTTLRILRTGGSQVCVDLLHAHRFILGRPWVESGSGNKWTAAKAEWGLGLR